MGEKSPGAVAFMVENTAITVGCDGKISEPELAVLSLNVGVGEVEMCGFDGFNFGSPEFDSAFQRVLYCVEKACFAVIAE